MDPKNLVDYLNNYVDEPQDKIAYLKFGTLDLELNISNLFMMLEKYHVKFPKIVVAQVLVETGYFTSRVCLECHESVWTEKAEQWGVLYFRYLGKNQSRLTGTMCNTSTKVVTIMISLIESDMPKALSIHLLSGR